MIDLGANPQAASDAARFSHSQASNTLYLETGLFAQVGAALSQLGHKVVAADGDDMGGFQAIELMRSGHEVRPGKPREQPIDGIYRGASDHRKDGEAVGW